MFSVVVYCLAYLVSQNCCCDSVSDAILTRFSRYDGTFGHK